MDKFWQFIKRGPVIFGFVTSFAAAVGVVWMFMGWVGDHVVLAGDMKPFAQQMEEIQKISTNNSFQIKLISKQDRYDELDARVWKIRDRYSGTDGRPSRLMPEETREMLREWEKEMVALDKEILILMEKIDQNE